MVSSFVSKIRDSGAGRALFGCSMTCVVGVGIGTLIFILVV